MTLVAVAASKFARGVESSADDWRQKNERKVRPLYDVMDLDAALAKEWGSDAHFVAYVMRDASGIAVEKQPRINKIGLPFVESLGFTVEISLLVCDVDNPDHCEWTPDLRDRAVEQHLTVPMLATAGVYATQHGRRILQPIDEPILAHDAEPYIERWLKELEDAGIAVDWACRDWTRHFRMPHVRRAHAPYRSPWVQV